MRPSVRSPGRIFTSNEAKLCRFASNGLARCCGGSGDVLRTTISENAILSGGCILIRDLLSSRDKGL